jgi:hypothetical protein
MPYVFSGGGAIQIASDPPDCCPSCTHDSCTCPCAVCEAYRAAPDRGLCNCVPCVAARSRPRPVAPPAQTGFGFADPEPFDTTPGRRARRGKAP